MNEDYSVSSMLARNLNQGKLIVSPISGVAVVRAWIVKPNIQFLIESDYVPVEKFVGKPSILS
jgi:hypothetical protein